jgi:hypothetical protein
MHMQRQLKSARDHKATGYRQCSGHLRTPSAPCTASLPSPQLDVTGYQATGDAFFALFERLRADRLTAGLRNRP